MFTVVIVILHPRSIQTRKILYPLFFAAFLLLAIPAPSKADQLQYLQCIAECENTAVGNCPTWCENSLGQPGPPPLPAPPVLFGAIALNRASLITGFAKGAASRATAEKRAIAQCRQAGGSAGGCKIIVVQHNSCMALATSAQGGSQDNAWGYAWSDDGWVSRRDAMKFCKKNNGTSCKVAVTFCTG